MVKSFKKFYGVDFAKIIYSKKLHGIHLDGFCIHLQNWFFFKWEIFLEGFLPQVRTSNLGLNLLEGGSVLYFNRNMRISPRFIKQNYVLFF